jgi:uncharacterized membrane protein YjjB (DUF3815 family)
LATVRPWIKYTLLRLLIFAVVLAVLLLVHVNAYVATVVAAIAGLAISYIFFRKLRDQVAAELAARRITPKARVDDDEEDALDERQ